MQLIFFVWMVSPFLFSPVLFLKDQSPKNSKCQDYSKNLTFVFIVKFLNYVNDCFLTQQAFFPQNSSHPCEKSTNPNPPDYTDHYLYISVQFLCFDPFK